MEWFLSMRGGLFLAAGFVAFALLGANLKTFAAAESTSVVGLNYGMLGDNLPAPDKVVALLKSRNIKIVRLFDPNQDALKALQSSGIDVVVGTRNEDLQKLGNDPAFAATWVNTNVVRYADLIQFRYVTAGNEVIPGNEAVNVLPAIKNLNAALKAANLTIPVSTVVATQVLGDSYPPSQGSFSESAGPAMVPLVAYLEAHNAPLLINVYPYFAHANDPKNVPLDYAIFTATAPVVTDGTLRYSNLFESIIDAMYSAIEKAGGPSVEIVVAETGWPSAGNGDMATITNAQTYINNLITHLSGTPKRPGKSIESYIFSIFNENLKTGGTTEQNFGLYYPNLTEVYPVNFSSILVAS